MDPITIIGIFVALIVGLAAGYFIRQMLYLRGRDNLKDEAVQIISDAEKKAKDIELQAKDKSFGILQQAESEANKRRQKLNQEEDRLQSRRNSQDQRTDRLEKIEQRLNKRQSSLDRRANEMKTMNETQLQKLEEISQMTRTEATEQLLQSAETEARNDMARIIRQVEAGSSSAWRFHTFHTLSTCVQPARFHTYRMTSTHTRILPSPPTLAFPSRPPRSALLFPAVTCTMSDDSYSASELRYVDRCGTGQAVHKLRVCGGTRAPRMELPASKPGIY